MNISQLVNYFESIPPSTWHTFFVLLGSSAGISIVLEMLKPTIKRLEVEHSLQAKRAIMLLLGLMSFTVTMAGDALQAFQQNPALLGNRTAEIAGIALVIYHFGGSSLYSRIRSFLNAAKSYLDNGSLPSDSRPTS